MILGLDLKRGDEVHRHQPELRPDDHHVGPAGAARRDRPQADSFKVPPPSQQYIVDQFRAAITPRTRVIEVTHITNLTGQIIPVKEIVELARPRGIEVFVDGAHAYAHFPFTRGRPGVRLLRHQPAQVAAGAGRHRVPLCEAGQDQKELWPLMAAAAGAWTRTSGSTRRSEPIPPRTTTRSRWRSPSIAPSARSGRSRGCATCGTAGPSGCWPRATGSGC